MARFLTCLLAALAGAPLAAAAAAAGAKPAAPSCTAGGGCLEEGTPVKADSLLQYRQVRVKKFTPLLEDDQDGVPPPRAAAGAAQAPTSGGHARGKSESGGQ
mmetsp:Transcript_78518/g.217090  ORF Transcript_78518/g.217090 Transcript_78518/m.217090 type:complete len:102 (-) Transcript_78518:91-396(-)